MRRDQLSARHQRSWGYLVRAKVLTLACATVVACAPPPPPPSNLPTAPAVLDITPAPTLDIDATATTYASLLRPTPTPAGLYIVKQGDTLGGLADEFGSTIEELMAANNISDPNSLQVGQALIIPSLLLTPQPGQAQPSPAASTVGTSELESATPTP